MANINSQNVPLLMDWLKTFNMDQGVEWNISLEQVLPHPGGGGGGGEIEITPGNIYIVYHAVVRVSSGGIYTYFATRCNVTSKFIRCLSLL